MLEVINKFEINSKIKSHEKYGNGHINDTYLVTTDDKRYILQKVNTNIFTDYDGLMENIFNITDFLRDKIIKNNGNPERETLNLIPSKDGKKYYKHGEDVWRIYSFIENTYCIDKLENPQDFYQSAVAFGNFQKMLDDFPADKLHETIPNFHNTPIRFENFEKAFKADKFNRAKEVKEQISFVLERKDTCKYLTDKLSKGQLPLRVTHNDTKLNNILIDKDSNKGICIIDLDTVMPGLVAYDFGDSIRFGANHCAEDEQDLGKVSFDKDLYNLYFKGFVEGSNGILTKEELASLPYGAYMMTFECGIRFLTDYLEGDTYFKTHYPMQNIYRANTQFKLAYQMSKELNLFK